MRSVLVSWFGATDLRAARGEPSVGEGPVAQALGKRSFDQVVIISNYKQSEAKEFSDWLKAKTNVPVEVRHAKLRSPTNYADIYAAATSVLEELLPRLDLKARITFHLSPGTPAMAATWILIAPRYKAELIQSSKEAGVESANVPFEIAAEFVPGLVTQGDAKLAELASGGYPADPTFEKILGRSEAVRAMLAHARQAAPYSAAVLIEGPSGTGKELLANAVHGASGRKGRFWPVNCGAIPANLVESTFFGHVRGAFTGSTGDAEGAFEIADRGTLFLDEVGELPLDAQVKLLRVLEEKKVRRVGGRAEKAVDVRVVAATNRDLMKEVEAGRFREDLYFRLAVLLLRTPALRERDGDITLLAEHFLQELNRERPTPEHKKLSAGAKSLLIAHRWPGNVRELRATLTRAFVWSKGTTIDEVSLGAALLTRSETAAREVLNRPLGNGFKLTELLGDVVRHYLTRAVEQSPNNKTHAASLVGFNNYQTLTNWAKKHGMNV